ncbi:MAG: glycine zipper family protein [Candidatus Nanoarchaeia archaeon]|nr:glycine zipper family protein [Candidatus Nanoarchaeia archaeon]
MTNISELEINKTGNKNVFKTFFIITNLVLTIVAFSYLISAEPTDWITESQFASQTEFPGASSYMLNGQNYYFNTPQLSDWVTTNDFMASKLLGGASSGAAGLSAVPDTSSLLPMTNQMNLLAGGGTGLTTRGTAPFYQATFSGQLKMAIESISKVPWFKFLGWVGIGAGIGALIGMVAGGKDGATWGAVSGGIGAGSAYLLAQWWGEKTLATSWVPIGIGLGIGATIFILTYQKEKKVIVEFNCRPFEPPVGGEDCELCNAFKTCSEYSCKSLGQACGIVNPGTTEQKCVWLNPRDVNSPIIFMTGVNKGLKYAPDKNLRPDKTGVVISKEDGSCVKAFTPLEFSISTKDSGTGVGEPSQCKVDYNLTIQFADMSYYMGGTNLFLYNHTETLSLPGPETINKISPELKNNGEYTLYIRCQDANGNFNVDPYSVRFCVEKGPDTTPPIIENTSILNGYPILFNKSSIIMEVYTNEPSECRWSKTDTSYSNMENNMSCDLNLWEMNIDNRYTCKVNLTGIESRKENDFYFRCKDKPGFEEKDRNVNTNSYKFVIFGTQPLNIIESEPKTTIRGATDVVPVTLTIKTDNGYRNGEANCYYKNSNMTNYIQFLETGTNEHKQRQDLGAGSYTYYFKCVDLGGNTAYNSTTFTVESDKSGPIVARVYKEIGQLKIKTTEEAECSYSNRDCNFEIDDGIKMTTTDFLIHTSEWKINLIYFIRCRDKYNNQPNPNICSIIVNPSIFAEGVTSSS